MKFIQSDWSLFILFCTLCDILIAKQSYQAKSVLSWQIHYNLDFWQSKIPVNFKKIVGIFTWVSCNEVCAKYHADLFHPINKSKKHDMLPCKCVFLRKYKSYYSNLPKLTGIFCEPWLLSFPLRLMFFMNMNMIILYLWISSAHSILISSQNINL